MIYGYGYSYPRAKITGAVGFTPTDLPNLKLWLDAADISTITKDGGDLVSNWADKSGLGNDAVQGVSTNQPLWQSASFGGNNKDSIFFTINDFLDLGTVLSKFPDHTLFVVVNFGSTATGNVIAERKSDGAAATAGVTCYFSAGNLDNWYGDGTNFRITSGGSTVSVGTDYSFNNTYESGDTLTVQRINGVNETETSGGGTATSIGGTKFKMSVGRTGDVNGQYITGNVAEIILCSSVITAQEILDTETYINNKYGIN